MPEAMLPTIVAVVCSERGRSERAGARGEHGADYGDIDGLPAAAVDGWLLSDQELMEIRRCRDGRADGRPFSQRAMLRTTLVATHATGGSERTMRLRRSLLS